MGYSLVSYVSSKAILWPNVEIGENCFVMEGSIIQPFARIGDDVTIGPGNRIGHHSVIGDHCFLASTCRSLRERHARIPLLHRRQRHDQECGHDRARVRHRCRNRDHEGHERTGGLRESSS